jgi:hypothetical protein
LDTFEVIAPVTTKDVEVIFVVVTLFETTRFANGCVMFAGFRDVRPAPFPLTFEKVTAPVTFRVVMLAVVAARVETFSVVRFAAPKRFEALMFDRVFP